MNQDYHGHEIEEPVGWLDKPKAVRRFFFAVYLICGALLVAEFFLFGVENAHPHPLEESVRFLVYPMYGFISFWFLVLVAKPMRKLLIRSEDYYERGSGDAE
jgi:hypothetical protein|tara:strand:- start:580 stop:885 length:306 start_codon:yes stop_codon:yes gene_type:complete